MNTQDTNPHPDAAEQASTMLKVIRKRNWAMSIFFGVFTLCTIGFLLFGKIPITGKGNAMFLTPETVIPFEATASGQISKWHVKVGDYFKKDQLMVELQQPLIEKQLENAKQKLADVEAKNRSVKSFMKIYTDLEKEALVHKQAMLKNRIAVLTKQVAKRKKNLNAIQVRKVKYLEQHERDLRVIRDLNQKRSEELSKKLVLTESLRKDRLRSADEVLRARQDDINQRYRLSSIDLQLLQLGFQKAQASESHIEALNRINEQEESIRNLEQQLEDLMNRETQLDEQFTSTLFSMRMEASEIKRAIERDTKQLTEGREIRSEYNGRILELTAGEGKLVTKGLRLGTIDTREASEILEAVAYFKLAEGKKIKPGMKLRLTPATVQRERFGSIITRVRSVSNFPVSREAASKIVGNASVAEFLTKDGHQIEVFAELLRDNVSFTGYQWDLSDGPEIEVTSGTIASAIINIEEKPPLTFIIPILRNWAGL